MTAGAQWRNCKEGNLQGKVRSLTLKHNKIIEENDSIWSEPAADNDPFWFTHYIDEAYFFDKEGKTLIYHAYFTDDADDNKTVNKYDSQGNLIEQAFSADGQSRGYMTYEYDDQGRITLVTRFDEDEMITDLIHHVRDVHRKLPLYKSDNNIWVYEYDLNGRCVQEKCLFPNGKVNFRNLLFYDKQDRITRMVTFDGKNKMISTVSYAYNPQGLIKQLVTSTPITLTVNRYQFDSYGNEISCQIVETDLQGQKMKHDGNTDLTADKSWHDFQKITNRSSQYRYDENGNWIERFYFANDKPQFAQKRIIVYWK